MCQTRGRSTGTAVAIRYDCMQEAIGCLIIQCLMSRLSPMGSYIHVCNGSNWKLYIPKHNSVADEWAALRKLMTDEGCRRLKKEAGGWALLCERAIACLFFTVWSDNATKQMPRTKL